jgi:S1-C subfamily serine protease
MKETKIISPVWSAGLILLGLTLPGVAAPAAIPEEDPRRDAVVSVIEQVIPAVVNIATVRPSYGYGPSDTMMSAGSGVVIDEAGYLLTNDHVVRDAGKIAVQFNFGTNLFYEATVVASDANRDVALLRLIARPGEKFHVIKLAREDDLLLGETVLALGNPFGLGGTVTRGILSSKSRLVPKEGARLELKNMLQTDAPINEGNSGGPLINLRGELIGINTAVVSEAQSLGFAIPIRIVEEALADIFPTEYVKSYWFGGRVKVGSYPLVVTSVQPESPAGQAGLKVGDAILQVRGKVPRSFIEFGDLLATNVAGEIPITIRRAGDTTELRVRLVPQNVVFNADLVRRKLGLDLQPRSGSPGLVVSSVQKDGPAQAAGLVEGVWITAVDGQILNDVTALAKLLYSKKSGDSVQLAVPVTQRVGPFTLQKMQLVKVVVR